MLIRACGPFVRTVTTAVVALRSSYRTESRIISMSSDAQAPRTARVAVCQMCSKDNQMSNYNSVARLAAEAKEAGAKLICFPEVNWRLNAYTARGSSIRALLPLTLVPCLAFAELQLSWLRSCAQPADCAITRGQRADLL
jgi:Carbon-nitrogen hydrolase